MGVVKINRPPEDWWERAYVFELVRGLGVTLRHALLSWITPSHRRTWEYPEVKRPIADRFRGIHELRRRPDGSPTCVACYCCQTVCTPNAIEIIAEESPDPAIEKRPKEFRINMIRCIFCGMCVEACPKDAIIMTREYELARETREELQFTLRDLLAKEEGGG